MQMIDNVIEFKKILKQEIEKKHLSFIFGNGINLHENTNSSSLVWNNFLTNLWNKLTNETISCLPSGITNTEFFDILNLRKDSSVNLEKEIQNYFKSNADKPTDYIKKLQNKMIEWDVPVLTTNLDELLATGLKSHILRTKPNKGFSSHYPHNVYYSNRELHSPTEGFGIWYINGMLKYISSYRFSLSQYMKLATKLQKQVKSLGYLANPSIQNTNLAANWEPATWMKNIFEHNLIIVGLGLDTNENVIRWLLIERAKYYNKYPQTKRKGWYVCLKKEIQSDEGKKMFLNNVGLEPVILNTYKQIYNSII